MGESPVGTDLGRVVIVLVVVCVVAGLPVLYLVDRVVKAHARARRLRRMSRRLAAATARAEKQQERRENEARASVALTSVIPAIKRPPLSMPEEPGNPEDALPHLGQ